MVGIALPEIYVAFSGLGLHVAIVHIRFNVVLVGFFDGDKGFVRGGSVDIHPLIDNHIRLKKNKRISDW